MYSEYSFKKKTKKPKQTQNRISQQRNCLLLYKPETQPISLANQNKLPHTEFQFLLGSERLFYCAVWNIRDSQGNTASSAKFSSKSHKPSPALTSAPVATGEVSHSYQCTTNSSQTWHMPACSPSEAGRTALPLVTLAILLMRGPQNPDFTLAGTSCHWIWVFSPNTGVKYNLFQL